MDLVIDMLDAMSNYDPTLKHFSAIRQAVLKMDPKPHELIIHINRACYEYLTETGGRIVPHNDTEQKQLVDGLPGAEELGDQLHRLGISTDDNIAYELVLWAAAMAASRFGLIPWNHMRELVANA